MIATATSGRKRTLRDVSNILTECHAQQQLLTPKARAMTTKRQCLRKIDCRSSPSASEAFDEAIVMRIFAFLDESECLELLQACRKYHGNQNLWKILLCRSSLGEYKFKQHPSDYRALYLRVKNEELYCSSYWLDGHTNLRQSFFPILCNWLVELHFELFGKENRRLMSHDPLGPIHLAVKYLYKFMSIEKGVSRSKLQLVGVSCYQVAINGLLNKRETAKLDLDSKRFAYYTDNAYSPTQVTSMTSHILDTLDFKMDVYTPKQALHDLLKKLKNSCTRLTKLFSHYFIDLCMHNISFTSIKPSTIAAAAYLSAAEKTKHPVPRGSKDMAILEDFCLEPQEMLETSKVISEVYDEAKKQETSDSFDMDRIPKHSMVIKHYQAEFIESIKGSLVKGRKVSLFR